MHSASERDASAGSANIGLGIAVGTTVHFLGLRNPIMWGVLVATLNFIPYLGALAGIICMTLGAVLSFDSLGYASPCRSWRHSKYSATTLNR